MSRVYKILTRRAWAEAAGAGAYRGSPVDLKDGFIHLSTAAQARETARLHFRGQVDLIVVGFEADDLGEALKWEPSRGGQLFPHLYRHLAPPKAVSLQAVPLDADGRPATPVLEP